MSNRHIGLIKHIPRDRHFAVNTSYTNFSSINFIISGAGTNLKLGGTGAEQKWGAPIRREGPKKMPLHVLALKAQLVVLVSAFVMVSTVWPVSCLLFFYSRCPRAQPFVKVRGRGGTWGHVPPRPHGVGATVHHVRA